MAPLFRFRDEADVIAQANATQYGLAAYFYARDLGRVFRVAEALEYGMVGVNSGIISTEVAPFGGVKQSGSAAKAHAMASRNSSRSNMCCWAGSIGRTASDVRRLTQKGRLSGPFSSNIVGSGRDGRGVSLA